MNAKTRRTLAATLGVTAAFMLATARADSDPAPAKAFAANLDPLRALPIQANGRVKPLDTFAREHVYAVTGEYGLRDAPGEDPVFTVLQMALEPAKFRERRVIVVRNLVLTEAFTGQPNISKTHVSVKDFE